MSEPRERLRIIEGAERRGRRRVGLKGELVLALLPTLVVLAILALVEVLCRQRLLFASLASSAFLIYLDPHHGQFCTYAFPGVAQASEVFPAPPFPVKKRKRVLSEAFHMVVSFKP